jgi:Fe-S-cluster containining protein
VAKKKSDAPNGTAANASAPVLLPIITKENDHPCHECNKCCSYVAIEHDEPSTMKDYDHMVWYLYHKDISIFVDWESAWYIKFESRCDNLTPQGLCSVYDHRPAICKDFDWRECENHLTPEDGPADKWVFKTADEFLAWFQEKRPKTYKRYLRFKKRRHAGAEDKELERVSESSAPTP